MSRLDVEKSRNAPCCLCNFVRKQLKDNGKR